jgi:hypothetical protein
MRTLISVLTLLACSACGNPGDISDSDYQKYRDLGAPKILYSCTGGVGDRALEHTTRVSMAAGIGAFVTYNELVSDAKAECSSGEFEILDGEQ